MTPCKNLFIQGHARNRLLQTALAVVPGGELIGSEGSAHRTQLCNLVFIYVNVIPLSILAEQALGCRVLSDIGQGDRDSPMLLIIPLM